MINFNLLSINYLITHIICAFYVLFFVSSRTNIDYMNIRSMRSTYESANLYILLMAILFAPVAVSLIFLAYMVHLREERSFLDINILVHKWEKKAAEISGIPRWSLREDKTEYYILMRAAAACISKKELLRISKLDPQHSFDKELINIVIDELLERQIFSID